MIVIGNGTSRKKINLNNRSQKKIGCNAVFRDTKVDYLVCCDKRMVTQALNYNQKNIYTRQRWHKDFRTEDVNPLPDLPYKGKDKKDDPFHWGSGPYALLLGCQLDTEIEMYGFDLYGTKGLVNNLYSDTDGYSTSTSKAVDHSYWVYQIGKIIKLFPNITFRIYNTHDWILPKTWQLDNVLLDKVEHL